VPYHYALRRIADGTYFSGHYIDDEGALYGFGNRLGIALAFKGPAAPDYLLGRREDPNEWVEPTVEVFEKPK
jgi:hypothetical protein